MSARLTLIWVIFFLSIFGVLGNSNASTISKKDQLSCALGKKLALQGDYSGALLQWRMFAAGPSQKEWVAASINCLERSKLAIGDKQVFEWLLKAAEAGGNYARVHLASIYLSGHGTNVDLERGRELLSESAAKGDEAAELLLKMLDKMTANVAENVGNCLKK